MNEDYYEDGYHRRWSLGHPSPEHLADAARFLALGCVTEHPYALDLGCGHGRYSVGLARAGARVVAVDASASLLQRAVSLAADGEPAIRWVRADMRWAPLRCVFTFILIVDAFGYFDARDDGAVILQQVHRLLRPDGCLVMRNPNGTRIREHFRSHDEEGRGATRTVLHRTLESSGRMLRENIAIHDGAGVHEFIRNAQIYSAAEIEQLLTTSGFIVERHLASPAGEPFDERSSPRMVTIARKAQEEP